MKLVSKEVNGKRTKVVDYPKLMVADDGETVLMESKGCGTTVYDPSNTHTIGHYSKAWAMDCFKDYHGKIELGME